MIFKSGYLLILSMCLALVACGDTPEAGMYYHGEHKEQFIELKPDNRFVLFKQGNKVEGTYSVENGQIKLQVIIPDIATLKGSTITDSSGETWTKQTASQ